MKVTKDVILDLLPLYQEGEVSADSRRLVEEFLSQDPELKERVKVSGVQVSARTLVRRELDDALSAMEKAKAALRYQKWMQFWAILFSLMPLSHMYRKGDFQFVLVRDLPWMAVLMWVAAVVFWVLYWRTWRIT